MRGFVHSLLASSLVLATTGLASARSVGVAAAVNQQARGTPPGEGVRTLAIGENVIFNEHIETNTAGLLQILLADGTAFTVGPNSSLAIDRFVYDPDAGTAEISATLTKGVFRFIGGRTSKTPGGVKLASPVGVIGIRGAVVDMEFQGPSRGRISMVFGKEVTLTAPNGRVSRLYQPGYSITVAPGGNAGFDVDVTRTPLEAANLIQRALSGAPGTSGGAVRQPNETLVASSDVGRENSDRSPAINTVPVPEPRPQPRGEVQTAIQNAGVDVVRDETIEVAQATQPASPTPTPTPTPTPNPGANPSPNPDPGQPQPQPDPAPTPQPNPQPQPEPQPNPQPQPDPEPEPEPEPEPQPQPQPQPNPQPNPQPQPQPVSTPVRLGTAGATYTTFDGRTVSNPGSVGLVGGTADEDRIVTLSAPASSSTQGTATTNRGDLVLPLYADGTGLSSRSIGANSGASLGGVPLAGSAYVGEEGFRFYALGLNGDPTQPVYALAGSSLADTSLLATGQIRTYGFTPDMLQNSAVPFVKANPGGADLAAASITPFYFVEGSFQVIPRLFQSWLVIEGAGTAQKSGVGVNTAQIQETSSGTPGFSFGRRGGYRNDALDYSYRLAGGVASVDAPSGASAFMGSNGQYLVLGTDTGSGESFVDRALDGDTNGSADYGTLHVLSLQSEQNVADFVAARNSTRNLGASGGPAVMQGFAAGNQEMRFGGANHLFPGVSDADLSGVYLELNAADNSVGGEIDVAFGTQGATHVAFGKGVRGNTNGGQSALIDDDMFGAIQNGRRTATTASIDDGNGNFVAYPQLQNENAKTYFLSGDSNPQPNLLPQGKMCECSFLEWGWWGTEVKASTSSANPNRTDIRSQVHLGTWAAGDITRASDLAPLAGTTATYQGHALGTVSAVTGGGIAQYVASGDMNMSYDFGTNSGNMVIGNFDGRSLSGTMTATSRGGAATFEGGIAEIGGLGSGASGTVRGAFVNDGPVPAKGMIGNFDAATPNREWSAVGIVAGAR